MRKIVWSFLMVMMAVAVADAQTPAKGKAAPPATPKAGTPAPSRPAPAPAASRAEVLATVNGEPVTRGEVVDYLSRYQLPPDQPQEDIYNRAIDAIVNTKILTQFLAKQKVQVTDEEIDKVINTDVAKQLASTNQTLATKLAEEGISMAEFRHRIFLRLQWKNYVMSRATDAELHKFAEANKDLINGTQVRASHILLAVEPNATPAEKEKVRQKLLNIKQEIESGKMTFAEAANKYSEDPINVQTKAGGDLNFFPRRGHFIEQFSAAAFGLKKGSISDPIETPFGYHLIQVTDRREGVPRDFQQAHDEILNLYAVDLQEKIIAEGRKTAKIDIKPMPTDLFQAPPAETPTPTPAPPLGGAASKTTKPAPR